MSRARRLVICVVGVGGYFPDCVVVGGHLMIRVENVARGLDPERVGDGQEVGTVAGIGVNICPKENCAANSVSADVRGYHPKRVSVGASEPRRAVRKNTADQEWQNLPPLVLSACFASIIVPCLLTFNCASSVGAWFSLHRESWSDCVDEIILFQPMFH